MPLPEVSSEDATNRSKRHLPLSLKFEKVPRRGKKLKIYKLFKDYVSQPKVPLTDASLKEAGYAFDPSPPVSHSCLAHSGPAQKTGLGFAPFQEVLPSPVVDQEVKKGGIREDLHKGSYRSRLEYTLFEKRLALEKALLGYEKETTLEDKKKHFKSKRLVTIGLPNKAYVLGYNPKTAYGLLGVANRLLEEGCCTMTQAAHTYLEATQKYAKVLGLDSTPPKLVNVIGRLRKIITEQLPVIRISGQKVGILFLDSVQSRQTYFFFPNLLGGIRDSEVIEQLKKVIDLKLRMLRVAEDLEKTKVSKRRKKRKQLENVPKDPLEGLNDLAEETSCGLEEVELSEEEKCLVKAMFGSEMLGSLALKNMKPNKASFHMPQREECLLM